MPIRVGLVLLAVAAALGAALPAAALVIPDASFPELVVQADAIVHGRVVEKRVAWNAARTVIFTHYTAEVDRTFKGFPSGRVEWTEVGGEIDGLRMHVEGTPRYEVGEEAVIFLHAEKGRTMTLRWYQGKLQVTSDWGGRRHVTLPEGQSVTLDELGRRIVELAPAGGRP